VGGGKTKLFAKIKLRILTEQKSKIQNQKSVILKVSYGYITMSSLFIKKKTSTHLYQTKGKFLRYQ
jgi:hypothetical protein